MINFDDYIINIPDFPKKGVIFRDITPLLANPKAYSYAIDMWSEKLAGFGATKIVAAESRGFFFAPAMAIKLGLPFVPVRKKGKLPRKTISVEFDLEYGTDMLFMHEGDVSSQDKVIVMDDILATGGTADGMCRLVELSGAKVACCTFFMELDGLKGREKLSGRDVVSIIKK